MDDSASSGRTNILKKIIGKFPIDRNQILSMCHNIFGFFVTEFKNIVNHLCLRSTKNSLFVSFIYHRKNLIAIDGELSYNDAVPFIIENNKSRYPVYLEDIDNIIGVLHIKDAFAFAQKNEVFRTSIKDIRG